MSSIVALSTPIGSSALALVRASGELCGELFPTLVNTPRLATLVEYRDKNGVLVDKLVATFFAKGASFTGEPSLELTPHGNPFIIQKIIEDLCARGFELAAPGEFTRRAFLNGRLDLTQAEAIADLIAARSEHALEAAHRALAGALGNKIRNASETLLSLIARVEAYIDFPEEDLPPESPLHGELRKLIEELTALSRTQEAHRRTFEGARVVFAGPTNAGKSSLFNAFVGHNRAIVSPTAGTTRDYLEARTTLGGHAVTLVDTAGLNATPGNIEKEGIALTHDQLSTADLVLYIQDGSLPFESPPANLEVTRTLFVFNKADLSGFRLTAVGGASVDESLSVSVMQNTGLEKLKAAIIRSLDKRLPQGDRLMVGARHAVALDLAVENLKQAQALLDKKDSPELCAHHLHATLGHLGEILGKFDNERILDKLFGEFCIGK